MATMTWKSWAAIGGLALGVASGCTEIGYGADAPEDVLHGLDEWEGADTYLTDDKENIMDYAHSSKVYRMGMPVGKQLTNWGGGAGQRWCTGFLVGPDLVMTNAHCVDPNPMAWEFHYEEDAAGNPTATYIYEVDALLASDAGLDVAIYRLDGFPGRRFGWVRFADRAPVVNEDLILIEHPAFDPKQVSIVDCYVSDAPGVDLYHRCDTLGGSSGSPVFLRDGRVIGLHRGGGADAVNPNSQNHAIQIRWILDWAHGQGIHLGHGPDGSQQSSSARDFDGNGKADIALARWIGASPTASTIRWYVLRSGGSSFTGWDHFSWDYGNPGETFLPGDFDGDGIDDMLLVREQSDTEVDLFVAVSSGTWFDDVSVWRNNAADGNLRWFVGDFNGDGKHDVAYAEGDSQWNFGTMDWFVMLSDGDGFGAPTQWMDGWGAYRDRFYVGDFDGDGDDDIATAQEINNWMLQWNVMLSSVTWTPMGNWGWLPLVDHFEDDGVWTADFGDPRDRFYVGDYDGDGTDDLLCAEEAGGSTVRLHVGLGQGWAFANDGQWAADFGDPGERLYVGDYNGDGMTDVALADEIDQWTVRWYVKRSTSFSFLSSSQWSGDFGNAGEIFY